MSNWVTYSITFMKSKQVMCNTFFFFSVTTSTLDLWGREEEFEMWIKQRWKVHLEKYKHNITRNDWQKDKKSRKISSNSNILLACVHYCYWQYKFFQMTPLWGKHHCFGSRANTQKRDTSMMAKYLISGSYFLPGCASIWVAAEHARAHVCVCFCVCFCDLKMKY